MAVDPKDPKYGLDKEGVQPKEYTTPVDKTGDRPASDWKPITADGVYGDPPDGVSRSVIENQT